jgi:hypothetical protein
MVSPEQRGFQAGALRLLNITALMLNQTDWSKSMFVRSSLFGMHSIGLFGDTISNGGNDSGLWVTEPMWHQGMKTISTPASELNN